MALAKAQGALEGRKAILLFSEGLQVPTSVEESFHTAISEANRANVSIYTVDARGLDTSRDLARGRRGAGQGRPHQPAGASAKRGAGGDVDRRGAERRARAVASLRRRHAGGAARAGRRAPAASLDRQHRTISARASSGSAPISPATTRSPTRRRRRGRRRFRKIEVKVTRKGVDVTSRSGYFALPATDTRAAPALRAAAARRRGRTPAPHAFDFQAGAFRFHETPRGRQFTLVAEVPIAALAVERRQEDEALPPARST